MKECKVVAAVIHDQNRIFATARGYGEFQGKWEFPGGKIEKGETPEEALKREIREELDTEIEVGELVGSVCFDYPTFHLCMDCFWCTIKCGNLVLKEAQEAKWLTFETIDDVDWLPADLELVKKIKQELSRERFAAFDTRKMDEYTRQARAVWGTTDAYKEYEQKSKDWTRADRTDIHRQMLDIFREFGEIRKSEPGSTEAQVLVKKLQDFISEKMYTCTNDILSGLGRMYGSGGDFTANIDRAGGEGTAQFACDAIQIYCG